MDCTRLWDSWLGLLKNIYAKVEAVYVNARNFAPQRRDLVKVADEDWEFEQNYEL